MPERLGIKLTDGLPFSVTPEPKVTGQADCKLHIIDKRSSTHTVQPSRRNPSKRIRLEHRTVRNSGDAPRRTVPRIWRLGRNVRQRDPPNAGSAGGVLR
jgi:hypothetical protein